MYKTGVVAAPRDNEVFPDAIVLLCETHDSTEIVSVEEMQLFQVFMMYSLNSQSPSERQQRVSLLRKEMRWWKQRTWHDFRGGRWEKVVEVQREQEKETTTATIF